MKIEDEKEGREKVSIYLERATDCDDTNAMSA